MHNKMDLFGMPERKDGIDGSAHILNNKGFIFIFNPTEKRYIGSIPLNEMIELSPGTKFIVTELYPQENRVLGSYNYSDMLLTDITANGGSKVIEIKPYTGPEIEQVKPTGAEIQPAFESD